MSDDQARAAEQSTWGHITGDVTRTLPRWEWWALWGTVTMSAVTFFLRVFVGIIR